MYFIWADRLAAGRPWGYSLSPLLYLDHNWQYWFLFLPFGLFVMSFACAAFTSASTAHPLQVTSEKSTRYRPSSAVASRRWITITFFGLSRRTASSQNTQSESLLLPCLHHRDRAFIIGMNKSFEWMSQDLMKNAFVFRQRSLPPLYFFFAAREELIYFCIANGAASEDWLH